MRRSLLWKLLGINLLVVGVAVAVAALAIGQLADTIFTNLMKEFHIQVDVMHRLFVAAMTRSLVLASLVAGVVGLILSLVLFRRVVRPLGGMMTMAERIAAGEYAARADVASPDEIGRLADSLNRMAGALQTLERLRKDLVANVAHELRTPLANLQGYLEAMRDGVTPASAATIGSLHEEVIRLVRLVEALHELSLFDARLPRLRLETLDLGTLVRRLVDLRRGEFAAQEIAVESQVTVNGVARADPDLLSQALHNLIDNALKYSRSGGRVEITALREGEFLSVLVADRGAGISEEEAEHVFDPFYRSRGTRTKGSGLGLTICARLCQAAGAEIALRPRDGGGTVASVRWPLAGGLAVP
jgi:signal transduction histidine kinase